jgi:hypothetical protein
VSESGGDISKTADSTSNNGDRSGQLNISRTAVTVAREELSLVQRRGLLQNEEEEVAFREYLGMWQYDLCRYGNFKLVANWGGCAVQ